MLGLEARTTAAQAPTPSPRRSKLDAIEAVDRAYKRRLTYRCGSAQDLHLLRHHTFVWRLAIRGEGTSIEHLYLAAKIAPERGVCQACCKRGGAFHNGGECDACGALQYAFAHRRCSRKVRSPTPPLRKTTLQRNSMPINRLLLPPGTAHQIRDAAFRLVCSGRRS